MISRSTITALAAAAPCLCTALPAAAQFAALANRARTHTAAAPASGGILHRQAPPLTLSLLQDAPAEAEPPPDSFWDGWDGSVAFGLNGNSGNTENLSLRATVSGKRATPDYETTFGFLYAYTNQNSNSTENRLRLDLRNDWLFGQDSRWRYFVSAFAEYDQFQDWDYRLGAFTGVGYDFIKNEKTTLTGRAGLGVVADFGGEDDDVNFEGLLGIDFSHQINDRNRIYASATYFPVINDLPEFRVEAKAGWEIKLDETNGMFLNLGIEDRYDSDPGGDAENNDLAYFALLGWNF